MKIWFDILTPKQILFFDPMIRKLKTNNSVLCTTRDYRELNELAKTKKMKTVVVGKHGGDSKSGKLDASLQRSAGLGKIIDRFKPDLAISFCSPEAARVAFGLGIKHVAFCDSPHAEAVMKLSVPMIQKLLAPWIIPKKEFTKYGIRGKKHHTIQGNFVHDNFERAAKGRDLPATVELSRHGHDAVATSQRALSFLREAGRGTTTSS